MHSCVAGKTMMAKAVAHHTTAAFIRVVGSEFVQKYLGEGPRMVRDVFRMARENAPAIIFIVRRKTHENKGVKI
jgi:26S proteasome regulatory subunit T3